MSLLGTTSTRLPPLREAATLVSEALGHRAELAALEIEEAGAHTRTSLLLLVAAFVFVLLSGVALTVVVASAVWDQPNRHLWLGGLCLAYLAIAGALGYVLYRRQRSWNPFAEIRHQLQEDHACLNRIVQSMVP